MEERNKTLREVNEALPVVSKINDLFFEADNRNQQLETCQAQLRALHSQRKNSRVNTIAVCAVACGILLRIASAGHIKPGVAILILLGIAVAGFLYVKGGESSFLRRLNYLKSQESDLEQGLNEISGQIYDLYLENQVVLDRIPRDYRNYEAVVFFENVLANGRADNMKEALSQYEEHIHRRRLEDNSAEALRMQQQQSEMLAAIEVSSRQTAVNSGVAAAFSVLTYLHNL